MQAKSMSILGTFAVSTLVLAGCASLPPPKELMDARASYQHAQAAPGAELTPVPLHEAKTALDDAERAFSDDADGQRTRPLAYVADRKAQRAEAEGNWAIAGKDKERVRSDVAAYQAQDLANTKQGLSYTQDELGRTTDRLNLTAVQLSNEKQAREAADRRTRDAMDKLGIAAALAIKEEPRGTVILLPGSVLFASNKAELLPTAKVKLDAVAEALKNQDDRKMVVEGHTDSQGTETSNVDLAQRRAQSVRDYLVSKGVRSESISASGIGQGRPIADNKSPEGRANNRRVEVVINTPERR